MIGRERRRLGADVVAAAYWYRAVEKRRAPGDPDGPAGAVLNGDRRANAATGSDPEEPPRRAYESSVAARLSGRSGRNETPARRDRAAARSGPRRGGGVARDRRERARAAAAGDDTERPPPPERTRTRRAARVKRSEKVLVKTGASLPGGGGVGATPDPTPTPTPIPTLTFPRSSGRPKGTPRDADADGAEAHHLRAA